MIVINRETELTPTLLYKVINKFLTSERPKLIQWEDYYMGKHDILSKTYQDKSKKCNRVVTNFCRIIVDTYSGYICGKPISYNSNDDIEEVQEVINYNDADSEDIKFIRNALTYGRAFELHWLDEWGKHRYSQMNPVNSFPIFDNTLDSKLLYFVRFYEADNVDDTERYIWEVYSDTDKKTYSSVGLNGALSFVAEEQHYFGEVPVAVFMLNDKEENIFDCIMSLNDAYNELVSSEIDDYQAFVDAYLVLSGGEIGTEEIGAMRENRVLLIPDGASANWLTKQVNDAQIENMLSNIRKNIFKVTACPDMTDENFLAQSGTALSYKLVGFENVASSIVANMTKAIQKRIELVCNILNLKASEAIWRDIQIIFTRNLPVNLTETIQIVNALKGTVSDATLLGLLPFVDDVQAEIEAIEKQKKENMSLYSFGMDIDDEEEIA